MRWLVSSNVTEYNFNVKRNTLGELEKIETPLPPWGEFSNGEQTGYLKWGRVLHVARVSAWELLIRRTGKHEARRTGEQRRVRVISRDNGRQWQMQIRASNPVSRALLFDLETRRATRSAYVDAL